MYGYKSTLYLHIYENTFGLLPRLRSRACAARPETVLRVPAKATTNFPPETQI